MKKKLELSKPDSCLNKAKDDDLIFVLIQKDADAPETIRYWAMRRVFRGKAKRDDPEIVSALQQADDMEAAQQIANVDKAREAIVSDAGPYQKGKGSSNTIDCPVCGGKHTLKYRRSGYNGHIHASCVTPDCVSWME